MPHFNHHFYTSLPGSVSTLISQTYNVYRGIRFSFEMYMCNICN